MVLLVGCLIGAIAVAGEQESARETCEGPYKDRKLTPDDLATVLSSHQAWLNSEREPNDTRRANLCQANLFGTNLQEADLLGANLQRARLGRANLQGADLGRANLQRADLGGANLQKAHLGGANLQGADLGRANLQGARLGRANLQKAYLSWANLQEANLYEANLQKAHLYEANLQKADLYRANLQEAHLLGANLQGAHLGGANLQEADLALARLQEAVYEPNPGKLPSFWTLTEPNNKLETLLFHRSPAALIALREAFKKGGMRTQERQLTYAIEHTRRLQAWDPSWFDLEGADTRPWLEKLAGKSESLFSYMLFELPSHYGMAPGRALVGLVLFIVLFSFPYMLAITARGPAGIWMIWLPDRVHNAEGEANPIRVTSAFLFSPLKMWAASRWRRGLSRGLSVLLIGLYFSLLSAFSLGWRELNVGTWISRVQPREYTLRATGWVRTVSGIQSLLSVYLLALWVLTYFGRPFE